ncbi:MAG: hypothetical protein Q4D60_11740 [Eubacteriales bacterium]|nr:hypothetical protein [Eubacteriales bacterium]
MGDFKKTNSAMQNAAAKREARSQGQSSTVKKLTGTDSKIKNKIISAKVYPETWERFTQINKAQGITNNSAINMIITKYIRENERMFNI